jgi:hypothetical protein
VRLEQRVSLVDRVAAASNRVELPKVVTLSQVIRRRPISCYAGAAALGAPARGLGLGDLPCGGVCVGYT